MPDDLGRTVRDLWEERPIAPARPLVLTHRGQENERRGNDERSLHAFGGVLDHCSIRSREVRDASHDAATDGIRDIRFLKKITSHRPELVLLGISRVEGCDDVGRWSE